VTPFDKPSDKPSRIVDQLRWLEQARLIATLLWTIAIWSSSKPIAARDPATNQPVARSFNLETQRCRRAAGAIGAPIEISVIGDLGPRLRRI
jgi:hypothetical protein